MDATRIQRAVLVTVAAIGGLVVLGLIGLTAYLQGSVYFVGAVTKVEARPSETVTPDSYDRATAVTFAVRHVWHGPKGSEITAYTWAKDAAPCPFPEIRKGRSYIVLGEWDAAQKQVVFDVCKNLFPDDTPDSPSIRWELDRFLVPEKKD